MSFTLVATSNIDNSRHPRGVPRLGVLFFLLLYLSLLSLTSLPVWREDRRLFLSESMGGAYGHLPYFTSVALADVLLVRVVPPLAFAVVAYPLMGLNDFPDGKWTLFWFALILVRGEGREGGREGEAGLCPHRDLLVCACFCWSQISLCGAVGVGRCWKSRLFFS